MKVPYRNLPGQRSSFRKSSIFQLQLILIFGNSYRYNSQLQLWNDKLLNSSIWDREDLIFGFLRFSTMKKVSSHAQIWPQGAEKQLMKVNVVGGGGGGRGQTPILLLLQMLAGAFARACQLYLEFELHWNQISPIQHRAIRGTYFLASWWQPRVPCRMSRTRYPAQSVFTVWYKNLLKSKFKRQNVKNFSSSMILLPTSSTSSDMTPTRLNVERKKEDIEIWGRIEI